MPSLVFDHDLAGLSATNAKAKSRQAFTRSEDRIEREHDKSTLAHTLTRAPEPAFEENTLIGFDPSNGELPRHRWIEADLFFTKNWRQSPPAARARTSLFKILSLIFSKHANADGCCDALQNAPLKRPVVGDHGMRRAGAKLNLFAISRHQDCSGRKGQVAVFGVGDHDSLVESRDTRRRDVDFGNDIAHAMRAGIDVRHRARNGGKPRAPAPIGTAGVQQARQCRQVELLTFRTLVLCDHGGREGKGGDHNEKKSGLRHGAHT